MTPFSSLSVSGNWQSRRVFFRIRRWKVAASRNCLGAPILRLGLGLMTPTGRCNLLDTIATGDARSESFDITTACS